LFPIQSSLAASAEKPSTRVKKTLNPESVKSGQIIAKPDLTVTKFNVFPSSPKYMEPITMYMWVKNIGAGDAKDSFEIKLYFVKDGNIHPVNFKVLNMGLGAGKEYMLQGSFVPKSSTSYKLVAMADVKDDVAELNEGNNFKEKSITIAQEHKPDLIVSRINMSPQKPKLNEGITYENNNILDITYEVVE
jgi:subtilase family serine protease